MDVIQKQKFLDKWASITVLEKYIDEFLSNIHYVIRLFEQIVTESLRVIRIFGDFMVKDQIIILMKFT
jgi:hypothetical protein